MDSQKNELRHGLARSLFIPFEKWGSGLPWGYSGWIQKWYSGSSQSDHMQGKCLTTCPIAPAKDYAFIFDGTKRNIFKLDKYQVILKE